MNENSGHLTKESIQKALDDIYNRYWDETRQRAESVLAFMDGVPEHLRQHPVIIRMAQAIASGAVFHPADARALREWYYDIVTTPPNGKEDDSA